jgi:hypothetical protein
MNNPEDMWEIYEELSKEGFEPSTLLIYPSDTQSAEEIFNELAEFAKNQVGK